MKFAKTFIVFLIINFGALGFGTLIMGQGVQSSWYLALNKAPWMPEGWVFGAAWTLIMILFSVYMTMLYLKRPTTKIATLFIVQFILNVSWNFLFFNQNLPDFALINIIALTVIICIFIISYIKELKVKSILILPYFVWLCIATSLNLYVSLYN